MSLQSLIYNLPNSPGGRAVYGPMFEMWKQRLREVEGLEAADPGAWAAPPWEPLLPQLWEVLFTTNLFPEIGGGRPRGSWGLRVWGGTEGGRPVLGQGKCL